MTHLFILLCLLLTFVPGEADAPPTRERPAPPVVAGYAPHGNGDWSVDASLPLTDILYFSVEPTVDGGVDARQLDGQVTEEVARLHEAYADRGGVRILLCVGGWGHSAGFAQATGDDTTRARFVAELVALCDRHGFDGIDLDWEHPRSAEEVASYTKLFIDLAAALGPAGRIVTVAQAGWQDLGRDAYDALDRVHLMSYDHRFPQATMAEAQADVERLVGWGCPPEKIALGLPFYGRNREGDARSYRALIADHEPDEEADDIDGYACNGPATVRAKTRFAMEQGLAGVMVWQVYHDAPGEDSLLRIIGETLDTDEGE